MNPFFNGLMIAGGLIVAIGAQNAFVLKQGVLKQHIGLVVFLCWLCDAVLMSCGVFGIAALLSGHSGAAAWLALAGGMFLLCYGLMNARRAWRGGGHLSVGSEQADNVSAAKVAATTLALTLLNPHVYIDTVMLIGGSAAPLAHRDKVWFLMGALTASAVWFAGLGYGARLLAPWFRRERVWQILESLIALMMFYLAYGLLKQAVSVLW